mgnify:CR=1 FL=1
MIVQAKKYGNSHVFPIPKAILELFNVQEETQFKLEADKNGFYFKKVEPHSETIDQLIDFSIDSNSELLQRLADK